MDGYLTKIGKYAVPVRFAQYPSVVDFKSGARGRFERGEYCFWTAVLNKKPIGKRGITGRARTILPPGERFCRIGKETRIAKHKEDRKAYKKLWAILGAGKNVLYVRPSVLREVKRWIKTHESDAKHIRSIRIGGKKIAHRV